MNKVLVIDDDKELCALMKKCVEQEDLSAAVAYGGVAKLSRMWLIPKDAEKSVDKRLKTGKEQKNEQNIIVGR